MYWGSLQDSYWKKDIHEIIDVQCPHLNVEIIKMRQHLSSISKSDTQNDDVEGEIDHWLYFFENFHQKYIIIPTESYICSVPEESRYIAVITPPGFINQENETGCYFNTTISLLY